MPLQRDTCQMVTLRLSQRRRTVTEEVTGSSHNQPRTRHRRRYRGWCPGLPTMATEPPLSLPDTLTGTATPRPGGCHRPPSPASNVPRDPGQVATFCLCSDVVTTLLRVRQSYSSVPSPPSLPPPWPKPPSTLTGKTATSLPTGRSPSTFVPSPIFTTQAGSHKPQHAVPFPL